VSPELGPGEIRLSHATRAFDVRADAAGTLRGLFSRGGAGAPSGPDRTPALVDVSLEIGAGETVGIVGRNGAGKTSTLKVLAGIIPLHSGSAECGGRVVSLLELAAGFSRDFSGRENIYLQGALYGFTQAQIDTKLELGHFIEVPIRTYSQGMLLRLGFSIAVHLEGDVMLIDEVLAVGDEGFQRKCLAKIAERIAARATLVLVSHDLSSIERACERVVVLDHGHVRYDGPVTGGLRRYRELVRAEEAGMAR
jgi:ABC-type polysaccharide/polyol phosphate transport system ATPase subunit